MAPTISTITTEAYVIDVNEHGIQLHFANQHAIDILRAHKLINHNNVTRIRTRDNYNDCINCDVQVCLKVKEFDFISRIPKTYGQRIQGKTIKIQSLIKKE